MAASPTGRSRPGFVTRPTPAPPSISMPLSVFVTAARISMPSVTSGSSPASFLTAQWAALPSMRQDSGSTSTGHPLGVTSRTTAGASPVSSRAAAPAAASAAQVPVV